MYGKASTRILAWAFWLDTGTTTAIIGPAVRPDQPCGGVLQNLVVAEHRTGLVVPR